MIRACMRTSTIFLFALLLWGAAAAHAASDPFPLYECIRPNVDFWKKIYGEYTTSQGLIHDSENLGIIYGPVDLGGDGDRGATVTGSKRVDQAKEKYDRILADLAAGMAPATDEEMRVAALFGAKAGPEDFAAARGRIRFQLGQKDRFREGIIRSGLYMNEIKKIIRSYDLPEDLAYLPHVESSFNYKAYSKLGAAGIWQFTESTGKRFLTVDYTVDERRDPLRATHAAAKYLQHAYRQLECWPSAVTSYNYGTAGMVRAKTAKGGYPKIFAEYAEGHFKFASRNFYSEFLAAREVAKNHRAYFGELNLAPPLKVCEIVLPGFAPIADLARRVNEDLETLKELNPALREPVFTGRKYVPKGYCLRIPEKSQEQLQALVAGLERGGGYREEQKRSRFYEVRRGDTVSSIARKHKIKVEELIAANDLGRRATIRLGQNLRIPGQDEESVVLAAGKAKRPAARAVEAAVAAAAAPVPAPEPAAAPDPVPGPEPVLVAMAVGPQETATDGLPLLSAVKVKVAPERAPAPAPEAPVNPTLVTGHLAVEKVTTRKGRTYGVIRVEPSETLSHYAEWLDTPAQEIRKLNGFKGNQSIRVHQDLKIPLHKVAKARFEERRYEYHKGIEEDFFAAYRSQETRKYQVRKGDSIWALLDQFEVPFWLVMKYNEAVDFNNLKPSQEIVIPVVEKIADNGTPAA